MKKTHFLAVYILLIVTLSSKAQEIKDQTQTALSFQETAYLNYSATQDESGKYLGGIKKEPYFLIAFKPYRVAPTSRHKEVYLSDNPKSSAAKWYNCDMYIPDNEAFPVTYVSTVYEGNKKLKEGIGYTARTGSYAKNRAVFLENKIYLIENWKSKDDYDLKSVLEVKKGKVSGFKLLRLSAQSPKKMATEQPKAKLQKYLNAATTKQKQVYSQWIKDPVNKALINNKADIAALMKKTIKKMSDDWLSSPEYKRIMKNNHLADEAAKRSQVTIKNNTGSKIMIKEERDGASVSGRLSPGSSGTFSCTTNIYYAIDHGGSTSTDSVRNKIYTANSGCGTTVTIN